MLLRSILLASALFLLAAAPATAQTCSFTPQTSALPSLPGRVTYTDTSTGQLFIYDFQSAAQVTIPSAVSSLGSSSNPITNPVFSPDGKALMFSGVSSNQRHLFYWVIGTTTVTNLTSPQGNLRHEDGKFSLDGSQIVWKRNGNIVTADLSTSGTPSLSNITAITTNGVLGTATEASGPVFARSMQYIYYFTGNASFTEQLARYTYASNSSGPVFSGADPTLQYYYPVAPDIYDLMFVRWIGSSNHHDEIMQYLRINSSFGVFGAADCAADNSDPAPVDERYILYSRDNNTGLGSAGQYELYLGTLASGAAWLLPSAVNTGGSSSFVGANYTTAR